MQNILSRAGRLDSKVKAMYDAIPGGSRGGRKRGVSKMKNELRDNADAVLEHTADRYGSPLQKYQKLLAVAKLKDADAPTPQELARYSRHSVKFPTALRWEYGYYKMEDESSDEKDASDQEEDGSDEEDEPEEEEEEDEEGGEEEGGGPEAEREREEDKRNTALLRTLVRTKTWKELGVLMLVDFDEEDIERTFKFGASKEEKAERESEVRRWNLHLVTLWMLAQRLEHVLGGEEFSMFNTAVKDSMEKKERMVDMLEEPGKWQEFARWIQRLAEKRLAMKMPEA
jgi:cobalamin biosynthesis protein CobT